jgi:NAD(P)-dependent dehydrogenase (short-subunit alcohol dehydrogenase family)
MENQRDFSVLVGHKIKNSDYHAAVELAKAQVLAAKAASIQRKQELDRQTECRPATSTRRCTPTMIMRLSRKFHPLGRMAEISDIVDAVLYLQNATFVTGENIRVDGGVHAGR